MDQHTVVFTAQRTLPGEVKHDELVGLVWAIFSKSKLGEERVQQLHDEHIPSPFVWSYSLTDNKAAITWSAYPDEIIEAFTEALKSSENKALTVPGSPYIIKDVYEVEDINYIPPRMTLHALSGVQVRHIVDKMLRPYWYEDDPEEWTKSMEKRVKAKADLYAPGTEHNIKIDRVQTLAVEKKEYLGKEFVTPKYQFRLTADPEAMKVALYAGVGQMCGTGFGHMVA